MNAAAWEKRLRQRLPDLATQKELAAMAEERDRLVAAGEAPNGQAMNDLATRFCKALEPAAKEVARSWGKGDSRAKADCRSVAESRIALVLLGMSPTAKPGSTLPTTTTLRSSDTIAGYVYRAVRNDVFDFMNGRLVGPKPKTRKKNAKEGKDKDNVDAEFACDLQEKRDGPVRNEETSYTQDDALSNVAFSRGRKRLRWRQILGFIEDDDRDTDIADNRRADAFRDRLKWVLDECCPTPKHWWIVLAITSNLSAASDLVPQATEYLEFGLDEVKTHLLDVERLVKEKSKDCRSRVARGLLNGPRSYNRSYKEPPKKSRKKSENSGQGSLAVPSSPIDGKSALEIAFPALAV
jgi:hypothetical protein